VIIEVCDACNNPVPGVVPTIVSSPPADAIRQPEPTGGKAVATGRIRSTDAGRSRIQVVVEGTAFRDSEVIVFK